MVKIARVPVIMGEHADDVEDNPEDGHGDFLIFFESSDPFREEDANSTNKATFEKYRYFAEIKSSKHFKSAQESE